MSDTSTTPHHHVGLDDCPACIEAQAAENDGERRCDECGDSFNVEQEGCEGEPGETLCGRCERLDDLEAREATTGDSEALAIGRAILDLFASTDNGPHGRMMTLHRFTEMAEPFAWSVNVYKGQTEDGYSYAPTLADALSAAVAKHKEASDAATT